MIFLILLFVGSVVSDSSCPVNYTEDGNGNCFQVLSDSLTYQQAVDACFAAGGRLGKILNAFDNSFVYGMVRSAGVEAWLGATCQSNYYEYCYWNDNSAFENTYYNFRNNYLSYNGTTTCVYMTKSGYWNVSDCTSSKGYLCSIPDPAFGPCYGYSLDPNRGYCFKAYNSQGATFSQAEANCQTEGGHLASIPYSYTNDFVAHLLCPECSTPLATAFIGLYDMGMNEYNWTDGTSWQQNDYNNFGYIQPTLGNCVTMSRINSTISAGQWLNADCNTATGYICKRPQGANTPAIPASRRIIV